MLRMLPATDAGCSAGRCGIQPHSHSQTPVTSAEQLGTKQCCWACRTQQPLPQECLPQMAVTACNAAARHSTAAGATAADSTAAASPKPQQQLLVCAPPPPPPPPPPPRHCSAAVPEGRGAQNAPAAAVCTPPHSSACPTRPRLWRLHGGQLLPSTTSGKLLAAASPAMIVRPQAQV